MIKIFNMNMVNRGNESQYLEKIVNSFIETHSAKVVGVNEKYLFLEYEGTDWLNKYKELDVENTQLKTKNIKVTNFNETISRYKTELESMRRIKDNYVKIIETMEAYCCSLKEAEFRIDTDKKNEEYRK